jgi:hypothetical protein
MELPEVRTFDVPMGILRLVEQIDHIGQPLVQDSDQRLPSRLAYVDYGFMQATSMVVFVNQLLPYWMALTAGGLACYETNKSVISA